MLQDSCSGTSLSSYFKLNVIKMTAATKNIKQIILSVFYRRQPIAFNRTKIHKSFILFLINCKNLDFQLKGCFKSIKKIYEGGLIVINNWRPVEDTTPPEKITDLRVLNAAADGNNVFTIGWTAPGDDLNKGQGQQVVY